MNERILFVDDDPNILEAYARKLRRVVSVYTAQGPHTGLREVREKGPFAVVVADMNMPLMNGVEFLEKVRQEAPDTVRMMLTGSADVRVAMEAVNSGNVFRFLTKPCPPKLMGESLLAGIRQYRLVTAEREVLEGTLNGVVELLVEILSWVNPEAFGRMIRLRACARELATAMQTPNAWEIDVAAVLSQVGAVALPPEVLARATAGEELTPEEKRLIAEIPATGQELLQRIPRFENVAQAVLYQGKRFDGGGLPDDGVAGTGLPLGARIIKVAADLCELQERGTTRREALKELHGRTGCYDPAVLRAATGAAAQHDPGDGRWHIAQLPLRELRPGLVLAGDITTIDGRKLVAAGTALSQPLLVRLRKFTELKGLTEPMEVRVRA